MNFKSLALSSSLRFLLSINNIINMRIALSMAKMCHSRSKSRLFSPAKNNQNEKKIPISIFSSLYDMELGAQIVLSYPAVPSWTHVHEHTSCLWRVHMILTLDYTCIPWFLSSHIYFLAYSILILITKWETFLSFLVRVIKIGFNTVDTYNVQ